MTAGAISSPPPDLPEVCHALMERSPVPMARLESAGHIIRYANPAFCRLVGKSKEALIGHAFSETVQAGDSCQEVLNRVLHSGEPEVHTEPERSGAHPAYWSYALWPVLDRDAKPAGVMMQVTETTAFHRQAGAMNEALLISAVHQHELTEAAERLNEQLQAENAERTRAERALRESERHKDEFLATLGHELRNPLAPLRNGLQIARLTCAADSPLSRTLEMMDRQLVHLVRLVDDLLDVGRISAGKIELRRQTVSLREVLASSAESAHAMIDQHRHELFLDAGAGEVLVEGDFDRLAQVFTNLLSNAAKYTEHGGRIRMSLAREGSEAVVRVSDTGVGIPPEDLPHVFDLFSQVRAHQCHAEGGLGIGLSLVRNLVLLHGGAVQASSEGPGLGSTFTVRLPALESERSGDDGHDSPQPAGDSMRRRVLVADDNADAAQSLAMLLTLEGHTVVVAHDGLEAVESARTFQPDTAILDLGMPRLDGLAAARRMRAQPGGQHMFLIALTGWSQELDRRRSREAGFDLHWVKPIDRARLAEVLSRHEFGRDH